MAKIAIGISLKKLLMSAIKKSKLDYSINKGEGAFYGPKIEFVLRDAIGEIGNAERYKLILIYQVDWSYLR